MKKVLFVGMMLIGMKCYADDSIVRSLSFTADSKTITLSTTPARPTQIFTKDSFIQRNWVITSSSFTIWVSSVNVTISTSSTNGFPSLQGVPSAPVTPLQWTPDGPNSAYNGAMWAVSDPFQAPPVVSVFRIK